MTFMHAYPTDFYSVFSLDNLGLASGNPSIQNCLMAAYNLIADCCDQWTHGPNGYIGFYKKDKKLYKNNLYTVNLIYFTYIGFVDHWNVRAFLWQASIISSESGSIRRFFFFFFFFVYQSELSLCETGLALHFIGTSHNALLLKLNFYILYIHII